MGFQVVEVENVVRARIEGDRFPSGNVLQVADLLVQVNPFFYDLAGTKGQFTGASAQALTDNAVNYVYVNVGGTLGISASGYPVTSHIRLARVVTNSGFIQQIYDERAFFTAAGAGGGSVVKAGTVPPSNFSGEPKRATVVFVVPFQNTGYSIVLAANSLLDRKFSPTAESKLATGFIINLGSNNVADLIEVGWHAVPNGE